MFMNTPFDSSTDESVTNSSNIEDTSPTVGVEDNEAHDLLINLFAPAKKHKETMIEEMQAEMPSVSEEELARRMRFMEYRRFISQNSNK